MRKTDSLLLEGINKKFTQSELGPQIQENSNY